MIKYDSSLKKQVQYYASEIERRTHLDPVEARYLTKIFFDCTKQYFEEHGYVTIPKLGKIYVDEVYDTCFWRYSRFRNTIIEKEDGKYLVRNKNDKKRKRKV